MLRANLLPLDSIFRKKGQIPLQLVRTEEEFGLTTFFFFKLMSHKLLNDRFGEFQFC